MNVLNNNSVLKFALFFWVLIAVLYLRHTPLDHRNHDYSHHLYYTEIIATQHRFPKPYEGTETYHPPLYYLINSFLAPESLKTDKVLHSNCVRGLSVFYGALTIILLSWFCSKFVPDKRARLIALLFLITTPKFMFIFSTYNVDSLATLISVAVITISYMLYTNWSKNLALVFLLISTAGIYTKYTTVFCMIVVSLMCSYNFLKGKLPNKKQFGIISIFVLAMILHYPWLINHNYKNTGRLTPTNTDFKIDQNLSIQSYFNSIRSVIRIPILQSTPHEWDEPWVYTIADHPETKANDYISTAFITSLIGEYVFSKPHKNFIWILYCIHLVLYIAAFMQVGLSPINKLAGSLIFLAHFVYLLMLGRVSIPVWAAYYDFRLICWSWLGWFILYSSLLVNGSKWWKKLFVASVVLHVYILLTVEGGYWY